MLKSTWQPTNEYYHRILAAPDAATRQQRYIDLLLAPWQQMMNTLLRGAPDSQNDPLAGARMWAWLLPDQVEAMQTLLTKLEAADAWRIGGEALAAAAARFAPYPRQLPFDCVEGWLMLADASRGNPLERGYTGGTDWFAPRFLGQFWEVNDDNLTRLPGLIAHEMHHLVRLRVFPWDMQRTSVADYIVLEATAESFATALFGEKVLGYYVSDFDTDQLDEARRLIGAGLDATGFNVIRSYIFGDALAERAGYEPLGGMPTYGGYAIGYHVVQAYMQRTGASIEETTFVPATEIVKESGFFDN